jgi:hypothetical protein
MASTENVPLVMNDEFGRTYLKEGLGLAFKVLFGNFLEHKIKSLLGYQVSLSKFELGTFV